MPFPAIVVLSFYPSSLEFCVQGCFRGLKLQNFLRRPTMVGDSLFHYLRFHITQKLPAGCKILILTTGRRLRDLQISPL